MSTSSLSSRGVKLETFSVPGCAGWVGDPWQMKHQLCSRGRTAIKSFKNTGSVKSMNGNFH